MTERNTSITKLTVTLEDRALEKEYQEYSARVDTAREQGILYFAIFLYIAYGVLDLIVLGENGPLAVAIRFVCTIFATAFVFGTRLTVIKKLFPYISSLIMCTGAFSISFFIWKDGSLETPYYVGIIVVVLLFSTLIRMYFAVSLVVLAAIYLSYFFATLGIEKGTAFVASNFFLTHSLILCATVIYGLEVRRRQEFLQQRKTTQLHGQLTAMVQDANESLKRKNAILNILTHSFKTPLHQIIGYSQILEHSNTHGDGNNEYAEYSSHITDAGQGLLRLVRRLIQYSRLDSGTVKVSNQRISANELISCVTSIVETQAAEKDVEIVYDRQSLHLMVDPNLMEDAVAEILTNAVEASPQGATVTLSVEADDTGIAISVTDQGDGIDMSNLDKIRNALEMTDEFLEVSEKMSLGLTLCEKIITLHDGALEIEHNDPTGTIVSLKLPAKAIAAPPQSRKAPQTEIQDNSKAA